MHSSFQQCLKLSGMGENMGFFPFYMNIENKKCLVVGGGNVALRKIERLIDFAPEITVVAPVVCDEIRKFSNVKIVMREFSDSDLEGAFMVIGATNSSSVNRHISELCTSRNIAVNIVDQPQLCSFYFPAIIKKDHLTVSVSTGGKSPLFAGYMKRKIEREIDEKTLKAAEILSQCRERIRDMFSNENERKAVLEGILDMCLEDELPSEAAAQIYLENMRRKYEDQDRNEKKQACTCSDGNGESSSAQCVPGD